MKTLIKCFSFLTVLALFFGCGADPAVIIKKEPRFEAEQRQEQSAPSNTTADAAAESPASPPAVADVSVSKIKFRCAYWKRPENPPEFFVFVDGEFQRLEMFELSFPKVVSVPGGEPVTIYVKSNEEYVPSFRLDTEGLTDCAAIIFPGFDPADESTHGQIHLFDFDERKAPFGSIVIYNWFEKEKELKSEIIFRGEGLAVPSVQTHSLGYGEFGVTKPIASDRCVCGLKLLVGGENGEPGNVIYSSNLTLRNNSCTYLFVIPSSGEESGRPECRTFKRR